MLDSGMALSALLEQSYNVRDKSDFKRLRVLAKLRRGGYTVQLKSVPAYLRALREIDFVESLVLRLLLGELINLDVGVTIDLLRLPEKERKSLIEEAEREASFQVEDSPMSECTSSGHEEARNKLAILCKGVLGLGQYLAERTTDREIFMVLVRTFEEKMLPLSDHSLTVTPLLLGAVVSNDAKYTKDFLSFLLARLAQESPLRQRKLLVYLSSFVVNLGELEPAVWEALLQRLLPLAAAWLGRKDGLASVCLDVLIRLSLKWGSSHPALAIDELILAVRDPRVKRKVDVHVQAFYRRRHPNYTVIAEAESARLPCPFTAAAAQCIKHALAKLAQ